MYHDRDSMLRRNSIFSCRIRIREAKPTQTIQSSRESRMVDDFGLCEENNADSAIGEAFPEGK
jgi:hypothetical protein